MKRLAFALALVACGHSSEPADTDETPPLVREDGTIKLPETSPIRGQLKVEPARTQAVTETLQVPAQVETDPTTTAKITPPLAGRVLRLFVHVGDTVKQGTPLFTMDSPDLVAAQSDYLHAQSTLAQAERDRKRQQDLKDHGVGSQKDLEQAETAEKIAHEDVERTTTRLQQLKIDPGNLGKPLTVYSPIPGRILDATVAPGEFRNDPTVVLMTIGDLSKVWLTANVPEKDVSKVEKNEQVTATLTAYPGETFNGSVLFVADVLDPDTRTLKVRIAMPNDASRLKPGMFATVTFHEHPVQAIVVPQTALVVRGDKTIVFKEVAPWTYVQKEVMTGVSQGNDIVIVKGLADDERVVTQNAVLLQ
ncbi:MAG TPA: efflux RND transporter periplasmic adaptor subunit [Kofleriaceae bacterium]|nr:efflux RND transporter periplasmic adaptor subunit [Kofleriaceae bacterium]